MTTTSEQRQNLAFQANKVSRRAMQLEKFSKTLAEKAVNDMIFNGSENLARIARLHQVTKLHTAKLWAKWEEVTSNLDEAIKHHAASIL